MSSGGAPVGLDAIGEPAVKHRRFNFTVMTLDYASFVLGVRFASTSAVQPESVQRLSAPNVVIGATPMIVTVGCAAPSLLVAGYAEPLTRKLPFVVVFLLMSVGVAAGMASDMNLSMESAPVAERPTYVALSMSMVAPVALPSPLVGGLLADAISDHAVILVAALAAAAGLLVLWTRVTDPRRVYCVPE